MKKIKITMTLPIEYIETLQGFISGGIGTSDDDQFSYEMKAVLRKLDNIVNKYYKKNKTQLPKPDIKIQNIYL